MAGSITGTDVLDRGVSSMDIQKERELMFKQSRDKPEWVLDQDAYERLKEATDTYNGLLAPKRTESNSMALISGSLGQVQRSLRGRIVTPEFAAAIRTQMLEICDLLDEAEGRE